MARIYTDDTDFLLMYGMVDFDLLDTRVLRLFSYSRLPVGGVRLWSAHDTFSAYAHSGEGH